MLNLSSVIECGHASFAVSLTELQHSREPTFGHQIQNERSHGIKRGLEIKLFGAVTL